MWRPTFTGEEVRNYWTRDQIGYYSSWERTLPWYSMQVTNGARRTNWRRVAAAESAKLEQGFFREGTDVIHTQAQRHRESSRRPVRDRMRTGFTALGCLNRCVSNPMLNPNWRPTEISTEVCLSKDVARRRV